MTDPYQLLGVAKTASEAEIKSAYRKLAKKLHPDVNPGRKDIEQKFKEVSAAYDILSDPAKRARYDRGEIDGGGNEKPFGGGGYRSYGGGDPFAHMRNRGGAGRQGGGDSFGGAAGMEDFFAEFFGGAGRAPGAGFGRGRTAAPEKGADVSYTLTIPFTEACLGGKQRVTLENKKTIDVTVPAGSTDGDKLRLRGLGEVGAGGPRGGDSGDAIFEIRVKPHAFFVRKENEIHLEAPISLIEAASGATIHVPTLDGQVAVKVPKGANTGTVLRLKGKGVPSAKGQGAGTAGDMFVKLKIMLPEPMPQDLADLIEKWGKKNAYDPRKKAGW
jgi:DnaJ-class molecular chaperone